MDHAAAASFVRAWVDAWNAHDIDRVLAHFHDDAVFSSPVAERLFPGSRGTMRGKDEIRRYWQNALAKIPDLKFEIERHFVGVDIIVIQYRNQRGSVVDEILLFDDGLVRSGHGTYLPEAVFPKAFQRTG